MRKLFTLAAALLASFNLWAADPTFESYDWSQTDVAAVVGTHGDITISGSLGSVGNVSGHYYLPISNNLKNSDSPWAGYLGIAATSPIDSIAIFYCPNGTNATNIAWAAWGEDVTPNQYTLGHGVTTGVTSSKAWASAVWETINLTSIDAYTIYLSRSIREFREIGGTSNISNFGAGQTINVLGIRVWLAPTCEQPTTPLSITSDASNPLYAGNTIHLTLSGGNGATKVLKLDGEVFEYLTWMATEGEHKFTVSQEANGEYCQQEAELTLNVLAATPVTAVTVDGPDAGFVDMPITLTATAANATEFRWMDADNSVIPGATEATYTFTPDVAGTWKFNCQARNQFNVDGSDNPTWQPSDIKFITVTHVAGELIKAELTSGSAATVTGVIGGTADVSLSSNKKMDKGKYFGITLAAGSFQEGDTVIITMTTAGGNYPCLFADKDRTNCLFLAEEGSSALEYRIILPAAATGLTSLYLARDADDATYKWNPVLSSISVVRPKFVKSSTETLTGVTINGEAIPIDGLIDYHNITYNEEYANAPTVVFTKHVVVTYEDDTQAERDEEITVVAEDKGDYFKATATIGGIEYSISTDKPTVYTVVFKDGEDELGSENVEVGSHPTAENIELPVKEFQVFAAWQKDGSDIALSDVSAAAGETVTLVARYAKVYSQSINIEQIVLDNSTKYDIAAAFVDKGIIAIDINDLDTLNDLDKKDNRNYAFLGLKVKKSSSTIAVLLANNSTLRVKFGNVGNAVNVRIGDADPIAKSAEDLAEPFVYTNESGEDIIVRFVSSGTKTVVFKQIMINEAIAEVTLPDPSAYALTIDASAGGTVKASWDGAEKDLSKVNAPINKNIILTITPATGYAIGLVKYEGTNTGSITINPDEGVYQFTMPEEEITVSVAFEEAIASVSLDVVFPLVGTEIENKIYGPTDNVAIITIPEGANYELTMYDFWEEGGNVELEGVLVENTTYEIRITVEAKAGFAFASNAPILVNGVAADHISNEAEFNRRDFIVSFQPRAIEEITEVAITIPSFPKLNETVGTNSFEASVPDDAGYTINNRSFFDEENNYLDHDDYVFTAGTYVVELGIFPKTGFAFPNDGTDCADGTKITMTVNGEAPYGWYGAWAIVPVLTIKAQFTLSAPDPTGIGNAEVEGDVQKVIRNGQLLIIRDGKTYNATGIEVR